MDTINIYFYWPFETFEVKIEVIIESILLIIYLSCWFQSDFVNKFMNNERTIFKGFVNEFISCSWIIKVYCFSFFALCLIHVVHGEIHPIKSYKWIMNEYIFFLINELGVNNVFQFFNYMNFKWINVYFLNTIEQI